MKVLGLRIVISDNLSREEERDDLATADRRKTTFHCKYKDISLMADCRMKCIDKQAGTKEIFESHREQQKQKFKSYGSFLYPPETVKNSFIFKVIF